MFPLQLQILASAWTLQCRPDGTTETTDPGLSSEKHQSGYQGQHPLKRNEVKVHLQKMSDNESYFHRLTKVV